MIECKIDSKVYLKNLPRSVSEQVKKTLSIQNPERENARNQKIPGWFNIPEKIFLYGEDSGELIIPRGIFDHLQDYFLHLGLDVNYDRKLVSVNVEMPSMAEDLRPHQTKAVEAICLSETGIYEAPPGSGKTVTTLAAISRLQQRSLVIVNTANIASQWADRCERFLGFRPGVIGDGQWDESKPITIALNQTLASRIDKLDDSWFDSWGFVCLDECHHVTANTFFLVMNSFPSRWRIGVSATPDRDNGLIEVAHSVLGPVIHKTEKQGLIEAGFLIKPKVVRVLTNFQFDYISTHYADNSCEFPGCTKIGKHRHQNNYQQMLKALAENDSRNSLIATKIRSNFDSSNLVLSKRIDHLHRIRNEVMKLDVFDPQRLFMLTGSETTDERMRVAEEAEGGQCVIFSTIADEALDVPRLDRLYLVWPTKNSAVIRQQVGRIERFHQQKKSAVVYDFVDRDISPLHQQWIKRSIEVYASDGLSIST